MLVILINLTNIRNVCLNDMTVIRCEPVFLEKKKLEKIGAKNVFGILTRKLQLLLESS